MSSTCFLCYTCDRVQKPMLTVGGLSIVPSMTSVKIDVWADICCPFCYVGERRLLKALDVLGLDAQIHWHAFELDPTAPPQIEEPLVEYLSDIMGATVASVTASVEVLSKDLGEWGIDFNWRDIKVGNTFNCHRLLKLAEEKSLDKPFRELLFESHHTKGLAIGQKSVLRQLALQVGLPEAEVDDVLDGVRYTAEVRADEDEASLNEIIAVPHYIINDSVSLSGAQSVEKFVAALGAQTSIGAPAAEECDKGACSTVKRG